MAAYRAITAHYADLVSGISRSVDFIANSCIQALLICDRTYNEAIDQNKLKDDRAKLLLADIFERIESQGEDVEASEKIFKKFLEVLCMDPTLETLAKRLEETLADIMSSIMPDQNQVVSEANNVPISDTQVGDPTASVVVANQGISSGRSRSQELLEENVDLKAIVAEKELKINRLEKSLQEETREKEAAAHKLKESERRIKYIEEVKDSEIAELTRQLSALKDKLAAQERTNKQMEENYMKRIESLELELKQKIKEYDDEKYKLTQQIFDLKYEVMKRQVSEKDLKLEIAEARLETERAMREAVEAENVKLKKSFAILNTT